MTFGQKLRTFRIEKGMTVAELAKFTGLSESAIKMYESGERKTPLPVAKMALASALRCKPSDLDDDREEG